MYILLLMASLLTGISEHFSVNKMQSDIASVQVMAHGDWRSLPVARLGQDDICIEFDQLSHEYHRYTYKLEHCDADWSISDGLFVSDYLDGFQEGMLVEDTEESLGTYQDYTHYSLRFPNEDCRITMSGNYLLTVMDDNDDSNSVLQVRFMILEPLMSIGMQVSGITDVDFNKQHQQLSMQLNYGRVNVTNPDQQITMVVMQNQRWDDARTKPQYQFQTHDGLRWEHCRDLIFSAGNEYHKFETLDPTHTTMGLADVGWDEEEQMWHAYVQPDIPARSYTYSPDANGAFLIRNSDNYHNATASEYIYTHFQLMAPRQQGKVYINGVWTSGSLLPQYEMKWNENEQCYENTLLLKQGYYSYRYLLLTPDGSLRSITSEGDFYETENQYEALVYYRAPGDRTDRLVGYTCSRRED